MSVPETAIEYDFQQLQPSAPPDPRAAEQRVSLAAAEAENIREQARAEGFEAGRAEGHEQGMHAVSSAASALVAAAQELSSASERAASELERDAMALALALAGKILAGTIDVEPERVLDVVRGALRHVADRRTITIIVDPADMEIVTAAVEELRSEAGGIEQCEVQADRRIGPGGAIVRTSEGEVDACLDTQLERAREVIAAELGGSSGR